MVPPTISLPVQNLPPFSRKLRVRLSPSLKRVTNKSQTPTNRWRSIVRSSLSPYFPSDTHQAGLKHEELNFRALRVSQCLCAAFTNYCSLNYSRSTSDTSGMQMKQATRKKKRKKRSRRRHSVCSTREKTNATPRGRQRRRKACRQKNRQHVFTKAH